ncbi:hypothetical protein DFH11DRAFT_1818386 [Phellopilus nigrolimitatus]|nr:hypothetical protein DFH11DRAFT_1818386 [Phellopilus nigrolimitatus]
MFLRFKWSFCVKLSQDAACWLVSPCSVQYFLESGPTRAVSGLRTVGTVNLLVGSAIKKQDRTGCASPFDGSKLAETGAKIEAGSGTGGTELGWIGTGGGDEVRKSKKAASQALYRARFKAYLPQRQKDSDEVRKSKKAASQALYRARFKAYLPQRQKDSDEVRKSKRAASQALYRERFKAYLKQLESDVQLCRDAFGLSREEALVLPPTLASTSDCFRTLQAENASLHIYVITLRKMLEDRGVRPPIPPSPIPPSPAPADPPAPGAGTGGALSSPALGSPISPLDMQQQQQQPPAPLMPPSPLGGSGAAAPVPYHPSHSAHPCRKHAHTMNGGSPFAVGVKRRRHSGVRSVGPGDNENGVYLQTPPSGTPPLAPAAPPPLMLPWQGQGQGQQQLSTHWHLPSPPLDVSTLQTGGSQHPGSQPQSAHPGYPTPPSSLLPPYVLRGATWVMQGQGQGAAQQHAKWEQQHARAGGADEQQQQLPQAAYAPPGFAAHYMYGGGAPVPPQQQQQQQQEMGGAAMFMPLPIPLRHAGGTRAARGCSRRPCRATAASAPVPAPAPVPVTKLGTSRRWP